MYTLLEAAVNTRDLTTLAAIWKGSEFDNRKPDQKHVIVIFSPLIVFKTNGGKKK